MDPDNRVYPPPRKMEQLWSEAEVKKVGMHIDATSDYSLLDEDRDDREGMGAVAWAVVVFVSVATVFVYVALRYWG
jgi:hypothetical protein